MGRDGCRRRRGNRGFREWLQAGFERGREGLEGEVALRALWGGGIYTMANEEHAGGGGVFVWHDGTSIV